MQCFKSKFLPRNFAQFIVKKDSVAYLIFSTFNNNYQNCYAFMLILSYHSTHANGLSYTKANNLLCNKFPNVRFRQRGRVRGVERNFFDRWTLSERLLLNAGFGTKFSRCINGNSGWTKKKQISVLFFCCYAASPLARYYAVARRLSLT